MSFKVATQNIKDQIKSLLNDNNIDEETVDKILSSVTTILRKELAQFRPKSSPKDPDRPKKPLSAFFLYCMDMRKNMNKEEKSSFKDTAQKFSEGWASLSPKSKSKYEKKSEKAKEKYKEEMKNYVAPSDDEIAEKDWKTKVKMYKGDPNEPKRPANLFQLYMKECEKGERAKAIEYWKSHVHKEDHPEHKKLVAKREKLMEEYIEQVRNWQPLKGEEREKIEEELARKKASKKTRSKKSNEESKDGFVLVKEELTELKANEHKAEILVEEKWKDIEFEQTEEDLFFKYPFEDGIVRFNLGTYDEKTFTYEADIYDFNGGEDEEFDHFCTKTMHIRIFKTETKSKNKTSKSKKSKTDTEQESPTRKRRFVIVKNFKDINTEGDFAIQYAKPESKWDSTSFKWEKELIPYEEELNIKKTKTVPRAGVIFKKDKRICRFVKIN
jgi:hypothetical protein